jgi:hypothetical protein
VPGPEAEPFDPVVHSLRLRIVISAAARTRNGTRAPQTVELGSAPSVPGILAVPRDVLASGLALGSVPGHVDHDCQGRAMPEQTAMTRSVLCVAVLVMAEAKARHTVKQKP